MLYRIYTDKSECVANVVVIILLTGTICGIISSSIIISNINNMPILLCESHKCQDGCNVVTNVFNQNIIVGSNITFWDCDIWNYLNINKSIIYRFNCFYENTKITIGNPYSGKKLGLILTLVILSILFIIAIILTGVFLSDLIPRIQNFCQSRNKSILIKINRLPDGSIA
jgi:hypothetical protein